MEADPENQEEFLRGQVESQLPPLLTYQLEHKVGNQKMAKNQQQKEKENWGETHTLELKGHQLLRTVGGYC